MKHTFFDFETMGQPVGNCAVIDCSFLTVDTERFLKNPYMPSDIGLVKKFKVSIKDQVDNYNWIVYKDTIEFWEKLPESARKHIYPKKTDLTVAQFIDRVIEYMTVQGKVDYWWSRSNTFDPVILDRIFCAENKSLIFREYFPFWKVRDIRTYIDAKLDFPKKNAFIPIADENHWKQIFVEHDSAWDVLADALRMQAIVRAENDLEQI